MRPPLSLRGKIILLSALPTVVVACAGFHLGMVLSDDRHEYVSPYDVAPISVSSADMLVVNEKDSGTYSTEALDVALSLYGQTWQSVKSGGLASVAEKSHYIDEQHRSDHYVPAVHGMERSARNSNGIFLGKENIISSITVFDREFYPLQKHVDKKYEEEYALLCMKQTKNDVRYVDYDGVPDSINGASSWIMTIRNTDQGWKVVSALAQDRGCLTPTQQW